MKYPLNLHADLTLHIDAHRVDIVGRQRNIILKFESVAALFKFLMHGGRLTRPIGSAIELNQLLCSTGMTVYIQNRTLPIAGANATNPVSRFFFWLIRLAHRG